ncbi:MAG: pseudouridine synthase [Acidobacteria bacterium]|nr:pseudouridine synthase [Acidobacteriota bacterium]MCB9399556.1 pseudouridine synthase [Acidobacteriota bacterium]
MERLQKILASAGIASRRMAESMIAEGRVTVNGQIVTEMGMKADPEVDHIKVDGKLLLKKELPIYCLLHKPKGVLSAAHDAEGKPVVTELMAHAIPERIFPVGRLDMNTEGALLLTNDGDLAHKLSHPASKCPKVYLAKVFGQPKIADLKRLERGITVDGTRYGPCQIELISSEHNSWVKVTLTEGKNHQIKNIFEAIGHPVSKLRRIAFAFLTVEDLEPGQFRLLDPDEVGRLKAGDYRLSHQFKFSSTMKKLGITPGPTKWVKRERKPFVKDINAPREKKRRDSEPKDYSEKPKLRSRENYRPGPRDPEQESSYPRRTPQPKFDNTQEDSGRFRRSDRDDRPPRRTDRDDRPPRRTSGDRPEWKDRAPREERGPREERRTRPTNRFREDGPAREDRRPHENQRFKEGGKGRETANDRGPKRFRDDQPRRDDNRPRTDRPPRQEYRSRDEDRPERSRAPRTRPDDNERPRRAPAKTRSHSDARAEKRFPSEGTKRFTKKDSSFSTFKKKSPKGRGK